MTEEEFESLREGWDFEAKLALGKDGKGSLPKSFWESYSAFANTEGGLILLGAKERPDGSLEIKGIEETDKVERELWNGLEDRGKTSANVLHKGSVRRLPIDDKTILIVEVPKARRSDRPVHINGSWDTGTYLRVYEGDRRASPDMARRMLADAQPEGDAKIVDGYSSGDFEISTVQAFRQRLVSTRPEHPFNSLQEDEFLEAIGALKVDRQRGGVGVTLGGLLMFGKERSIVDRFPNWHLSYKEISPENERWSDRVVPDGTWNANVFEFYTRVINKLFEGLKLPFSLQERQFRKGTTSAHAALREAIVNTLIHADYEGKTGIRITRSPSEYKFINPGLLLVAPKQVWKGGMSECRNPFLQRFFGYIQLSEREGTGGPTIRRAWKEHHWRLPILQEDVEHGEVHLHLQTLSLFPTDALEAVRDLFGHPFEAQDQRGKLTLVTAFTEQGVTHARLTGLTDKHSREVTLKLQELVRKGMLVSCGPLRSKRYLLPSQARSASSLTIFFDEDSLEQSGGDSVQSSEQSGGDSVQSSEQSEGDSVQSSEQSEDNSEQSEEVRLQEQRLPAERGWNSIEIQMNEVLDFCEGEWRSLPEIAYALHRAQSTVRTHYLRTLIKAGRIERRYQNPNHPAQAYRTKR